MTKWHYGNPSMEDRASRNETERRLMEEINEEIHSRYNISVSLKFDNYGGDQNTEGEFLVKKVMSS